jgi:hypothetical protein
MSTTLSTILHKYGSRRLGGPSAIQTMSDDDAELNNAGRPKRNGALGPGQSKAIAGDFSVSQRRQKDQIVWVIQNGWTAF